MTEAIVRTEDRDQFGFGLHRRDVLGLNVFQANLSEEEQKHESDPRVAFLKSLAVNGSCSAHVGLLWGNFDDYDLRGYLDAATEPLDWTYTQVLVYDGFQMVSDLSEGPAGCFFPTAPITLLDQHGSGVLGMLTCAQLALYVGMNDRIRKRVQKLVENPPVVALPPRTTDDEGRGPRSRQGLAYESAWLNALADLYPLLIVTGHDGRDFEAYSRDVNHFDLLSSPIADAVRTIESSSWYQKHRTELYWDEERAPCLKLNT